ncbi:UTP--glucose-1-phosphate uridylyltransferase, partial [Thermodesulfobacteriota bacterium]
MSTAANKDQIRKRMRERGLSEHEIKRFLKMVPETDRKESGSILLSEITAADTSAILDVDSLAGEIKDLDRRGKELLSKVVVIKLNGGRSTTMGGDVPKGTLTAKDGLSYLEIISRQIEAFDKHWQEPVPLVLMDSFFTHAPTLAIIDRFPVPIRTFQQSQVPRLLQDSLAPLDTGTEEDWVPPGHGDIYESLDHSGLLKQLLAEGRRWAFISNLDNLAATLEPWIPALIEREEIDFLLEVTDRTETDRKGGTLIVRNGRPDLLEIAQVSAGDKQRFQDIDRFPVFNTNNVWVDLQALSDLLAKDNLKLPVMQNRKEIMGHRIIQ